MSSQLQANEVAHVDGKDDQRALIELRSALSSQPKWIKVHAGEALIKAGYPEEVEKTFRREWELFHDVPEYRIGIMRVLARCYAGTGPTVEWTNRIKEAFFDRSGKDRVHAAESIAKLCVALSPEEFSTAVDIVGSSDEALAINTCWALAMNGSTTHCKLLERYLRSENPSLRLVAAHAIRTLPAVADTTAQLLYKTAQEEERASTAYAFLMSASFVIANKGSEDGAQRYDLALKALLREGKPRERCESCNAYAVTGRDNDTASILALMQHPDADVRVAAASAILQIDMRACNATQSNKE